MPWSNFQRWTEGLYSTAHVYETLYYQPSVTQIMKVCPGSLPVFGEMYSFTVFKIIYWIHKIPFEFSILNPCAANTIQNFQNAYNLIHISSHRWAQRKNQHISWYLSCCLDSLEHSVENRFLKPENLSISLHGTTNETKMATVLCQA